MLHKDNLLIVFETLNKTVEEKGMQGYDPRLLWYLPLASRYHKKKNKLNNFLRRCEVLLTKKLFPFIIPYYLRVCGIPTVTNPYGIALLVQSYVVMFNKTKNIKWLDYAKKWEIELNKYLRCTSSNGIGIGVPLEDEEVFNVPSGAEVALAYLLLFKATSDSYYFNIADKISHSFLNDFKLKKVRNGICIDYFSNNDGMHIINANALAMEVIYRVNEVNKIHEVEQVVNGMMQYNIYYLEKYKKLPYSGDEDKIGSGVTKVYDVFHTGFALRSINYVATNNSRYSGVRDLINQAFEQMKSTFLNKDNYIRVSETSKSIDIHGVAEFIRCIAQFGDKDFDYNLAIKNFNYMYNDGSFYYTRNFFSTKLYMPRWGHAPMMLALSELL